MLADKQPAEQTNGDETITFTVNWVNNDDDDDDDDIVFHAGDDV